MSTSTPKGPVVLSVTSGRSPVEQSTIYSISLLVKGKKGQWLIRHCEGKDAGPIWDEWNTTGSKMRRTGGLSIIFSPGIKPLDPPKVQKHIPD